jgi:hypothetical protein
MKIFESSKMYISEIKINSGYSLFKNSQNAIKKWENHHRILKYFVLKQVIPIESY